MNRKDISKAWETRRLRYGPSGHSRTKKVQVPEKTNLAKSYEIVLNSIIQKSIFVKGQLHEVNRLIAFLETLEHETCCNR